MKNHDFWGSARRGAGRVPAWGGFPGGIIFHASSTGVMPKHGLDVSACEVFRFYKLVTLKGLIEPISMIVPRRVSPRGACGGGCEDMAGAEQHPWVPKIGAASPQGCLYRPPLPLPALQLQFPARGAAPGVPVHKPNAPCEPHRVVLSRDQGLEGPVWPCAALVTFSCKV